MSATVEDLRLTIVPRSDQLNAEQLLNGPMTVTVTDVRLGSSQEQPVIVHYEGEDGRPYLPCKTCRKILIHAWGENGRAWIGKSMTLYNDPAVKFGGADVGGIRISHMTDIERDVQVSLTATKGKKALHTIKRMEAGPRLFDVLQAIQAATDKAGMDAAKKMAKALTTDADISAALAAYQARVQVLKTGAAIGAEPGFGDLAH